ncbi:hypothetical protein GCM10009117_17410 [Gangjinia marincola]|uniref:Secretion system C-terminal sorting domain-containing protein n=2 Tax=Gangjinia marincola TaxID=578463 RepID=A0ABP3XW34_9FLAO
MTYAQDGAKKVEYIGKLDKPTYVPSIASRMAEHTPARTKPVQMEDGRSTRFPNVVPGKGSVGDVLAANPHRLAGKIPTKAPDLVWDAAFSNSQPTDPSLAVGPNHVFVVFNTGYVIYDKEGNNLAGPFAPNPSIFPNGGCCDLTVSYDNAADRWVLSFLGGGAQIAVSDGPDPVTSGWNVYNINTINDYQKLSVWSDGYYMTDQSNGNRVYALERDEMLAGNAAQILGFQLPDFSNFGFASPQALNITDDNMPAPGNAPIVFFQDDAYAGITTDQIKFWNVQVDWDNPGSSLITAPQVIDVTPFTSIFDNASFSNLPQPNGGAQIDALQGIVMNQAQFRKFAGYNSAVFNFVVDTDPTSGKLAGVRWYEFRQTNDGDPWVLHQEGTYNAPDGKNAWNASLAMDAQGNIGMGYSAMNGVNDVFVGSYYTGRFANDPLGTMTIVEEVIAEGNGNVPSIRYGDYSKIDVDPANDKAFYFINEYINPNNQRADVAARFQIAPNFNDDVGVVSIDSPATGTLSNAEEVTVTVFNFGQNDASGFDVTFQIDGGAVVTEAFPGTLASTETAQFTFTATADVGTVGQTYSITASTVYAADEDNTNDATTAEVTFLEPNDIGVTSIVSPVSGTNLVNNEQVTVLIENFGGEAQSGFDVSYDLDGTIVTEVVGGPLESGDILEYTFSQTANLAAFGTYNLSATTSLPGDSDTSNDSASAVITNSNCQPGANCTIGDGIRLFELANINNPSDCSTGGYGDFTNLMADIVQGSNADLTLATDFSNQFVTVWIDYNDDFVFTSNEKIVDNFNLPSALPNTHTTQINVPVNAPIGQHLMRAKANWNANVPDDACEETTFGETEDYMANILDLLGVQDEVFNDDNFTFIETTPDVFDATLIAPSYENKVNITVHDINGKQIINHKIERGGDGTFSYNLDMSYMSAGVYLFKIGNNDGGLVRKFIVK